MMHSTSFGKGSDTPVLLLVFNRPRMTETVFRAIRTAKPRSLYVAADGPRRDVPSDESRCAAARSETEHVDWPCEVHRRYLSENAGCGRGVSSAITWFFEQVQEGIVLEDDIVPDPSFFPFCAALLDRYRDDARVMHIGGNNFQFGRRCGWGSYYASRYSHIWGWATWRRAWKHYDFKLERLSAFLDSNRMNSITPDPDEQAFWVKEFGKHREGLIDNWDAQWLFSVWDRDGIALLPNRNLISNIGIGPEATHTRKMQSRYVQMRTRSIRGLVHPRKLVPNRAADAFTFETLFRGKALPARLPRRLVRRVFRLLRCSGGAPTS